MKAKYPEGDYYLKKNILKVKVILQPTECSRKYTVEILFKNKDCDVWLLDNVESL